MSINEFKTSLKKYLLSNKTVFLIIFFLLLSRLFLYLFFIFFALKNNISKSFLSYLDWINNSGMDSGWYNDIINNGYRMTSGPGPDRYNWNFFPGFPLLIKLIKLACPFFSNNFLIAYIINNILIFFTCYIVYKYLMSTRKCRNFALLSIFIILFGPWSFYTTQLMSESLYMFLLILCFYFLIKEKYVLMGISGAFLTLTRSTGILFIFVALLYYFKTFRFRKTQKHFVSQFFKFLFKNSSFILGLSLIPIGLFSYMLYLQIKIGDGFGFIHSQTYGWGHSLKYTFFYLLIKDFSEGRALLAIIVCLFVGISLYMFYEKKGYEAIMPLLIFFTAHNSSFNGLQRYAYSSLTILFGFIDILYLIPVFSKKYSKIILNCGLICFNLSIYYCLLSRTYTFLYV